MNQEIDMFHRANQAFGACVSQINDDQWELPTPDTEWTVRDLVRHGLEAELWVPDVLSGRTIEEVGDKYEGDILGANPKTSWVIAADKAGRALDGLVHLDATVHLSSGDYPARTYLQQQLIDLTIHAWDLAHAIGADEALDADLVKAAFEWFEPQAEEWREKGLLGPAIPVAPDADMQTKLLGLSGRKIQ